MTDREKLIELMNENFTEYCNVDIVAGHCKIRAITFDVDRFADFLISNGVTVQECGHWISLTECANAGVYCSVCHKKVYKEDYAWCNRKNKLRSDYCPHCGAKMTPQPPKGGMCNE